MQGRPSPSEPAEGSGAVGGSQSVVDSTDRPAGMSAGKHRLRRPASIGDPRRGELAIVFEVGIAKKEGMPRSWCFSRRHQKKEGHPHGQ